MITLSGSHACHAALPVPGVGVTLPKRQDGLNDLAPAKLSGLRVLSLPRKQDNQRMVPALRAHELETIP